MESAWVLSERFSRLQRYTIATMTEGGISAEAEAGAEEEREWETSVLLRRLMASRR
jgi:hypothetical protein